jgi:hypothetical protein
MYKQVNFFGLPAALLFLVIACADPSGSKKEEVNNKVSITEEILEPVKEKPDPGPVQTASNGPGIPDDKKESSNEAELLKNRKSGQKEVFQPSQAALNKTKALVRKQFEKSEFFYVDNSENVKLVTASGSTISIPKDCFVNSNGRYERNQVKVEYKEISNKDALFSYGLPTSSGNRLLESAGVVYLNAVGSDGPVTMAEGKSIEVMFAQNNLDKDMMLFPGVADENGNISWKDPVKMNGNDRKEKKIRFSYAWNFLSFGNEYKMDFKTKGGGYCPTYEFYTQSNSKPGTREEQMEFSERLKYISALGAIAKCKGDFGFDAYEYVQYYLNAPGASFNNIDKRINDKLRTINSKALADLVCYDPYSSQDTLINAFYMIKDQFALYAIKPDKLPSSLDAYGINLGSPNALKELKGKGIEEERAKSIIAYYKAKVEFDKKQEADKALAMTRLRQIETKAVVGYPVAFTKLGYINIDKFYSEPNVVASEITIRLNGGEMAKNAKVGMVFKKRKSYLELREVAAGQYSIGKEGNLPSNDPVQLIAVSYLDEKIYFGEKASTISASVNEELVMKQISLEDLKRKLAALN